MKFEEFAREMYAYRKDVHDEETWLRIPGHVSDSLEKLYRRLDADECLMANQVISDWILSNDELMSYDGCRLARTFKIKSAVPALEELLQRLEKRSAATLNSLRSLITDLCAENEA